ncbi:T6SS effector BTH_I2691 family protein [Vibrio sp. H11]|uniref:T6SS effector BTH_I2691 family protein n=1 Tax=Vibrio sp. H11 TaxID=2565928 RepID=UPI0010A68D11|nr:T6SS effector BTH_I2691 family protein [Vibrio sp. H11]
MSGAMNSAKSGQTKDSQDPAGTCPLKLSMLGIIPVRYAFDDNDEHGDQLHPFPDDGKRWQGRFKSDERHYTLRQLRDGWIYVFDQTANTFHEYQVLGCKFIKIDWSSDEATKPAAGRGSKGETKSCLFYPSTHTLFIGYAHQRWTWRVCEHMRSDSGSRNALMRKLSLNQCDENSALPHAQFARYLGDYVADIDVSDQNELFEHTCTPLSASEQQDDTPSESEFNLVAVKPAAASSEYLSDLPEQTSAVFVALDDPLADTSDLFIQFAKQVGSRSQLMGDEDKQHKLQMAALTRSLGRVTVEEKDLPEYIKQDPIRLLEFEKALTEYVATAELAEIEFTDAASQGVVPIFDSPIQKEADQQLAELKRMYNFSPSSQQMRDWKTKNNVFHDEVRWDDLDNFLIEHYTQLEGLDEQIQAHYAKFMTAFNQLGTDPVSLGIDNQDAYQQAYLMDLVSQFLAVVTQANSSEKGLARLKKELSFDSPKNLMALASAGFSVEANKAINEHVKDFSTSFLSLSTPSDMVALSTAIANWDTFTGDSRIQEKAWFKSLIDPIQLSFSAMQSAIANQAKDSWGALQELLFPYQYARKPGTQSLLSNIRLILVENIVNEDAVLKSNPNYAKELGNFGVKLNNILKEIDGAINLKPGKISPKNHQVGMANAARRKLENLYSKELPMMVTLKEQAAMKTFQQSVNEKLEAVWQKTKVNSTSVSNSLGGLGGLVFALNLWNTMAVLEALPQKLADNSSLSPLDNPAVGEALYATGYTLAAAGAISVAKSWEIIATRKSLLRLSLNMAINNNPGSVAGSALKTFSKSMALVSTVGMLASALETWESWGRLNDSSKPDMERIGYGIKMVATAAQGAVFSVQLITFFASRLGLFSITVGAIYAGWMLAALSIIGFLYLLAVIMTNVFKRSDMEQWLINSTWGTETESWPPTQELINLELLIHRPVIRLKSVLKELPDNQRYNFKMQWQLEIEVPSYLENRTIGLQITRLPKQSPSSYHITDEKSLVLINEQLGKWESDDEKLLYRLNLGGSDHDIVSVCLALPFNWINQKNKAIQFCAKGQSNGELALHPIEDEDFGKRNLLVGNPDDK